MTTHIEGLVAAPLTPMHDDGRVNLDRIAEQANLLRRNGVRGAFVCGTTGECHSLTVAERMDVTRRWAETAPGGLLVIAQVGTNCLADCKALAAQAAEVGAWGIGAMGPFFFRPRTIDALAAFCAEVASAAPGLPFYYYHIPSLTGLDFAMADFLPVAADRIPTFAGLKYTWRDMEDYGRCLDVSAGRFDLLFGHDEILLCGLALGAKGAVGSTYNFAAPLYLALIEAFRTGDLERARTLQSQSREIIHVLSRATGSFLPAAKAAMAMAGLDCGPVRPPLVNLTAAEFVGLRTELQRVGFFEVRSR